MKVAVLISTILIVLGGFAGNYLRFIEVEPDRPPDFSNLPYRSGEYFSKEQRFSELSYDVLEADTTTLRNYVDANGTVHWLFIAYFNSQKYGSQIHSPKHCLPGGGWKIERLEPFLLQLSDGTSKDVNRVFIRNQTSRQLMLYWFESRSGSIRSEFGVKWDLMKNSLLLRPTDAAFVRLSVPIQNGDIKGATANAIEFFNTFHTDIESALPFDD
ncbi:MAG: EpsI family protein [candidate division Zixibacteria bacterium]|nr:EpsI family protein [candidate division Zixibacteria bacterium]